MMIAVLMFLQRLVVVSSVILVAMVPLSEKGSVTVILVGNIIWNSLNMYVKANNITTL